MSDMKCPFCNGELVGTIGHPICRNQDCVMCDDPMPQELLELLDRTRKALDVAVDALKYIRRTNPISFHFEAIEKTLEQITALEQKDHFADVSKMIEQKD